MECEGSDECVECIECVECDRCGGGELSEGVWIVIGVCSVRVLRGCMYKA